MQETQGWCTEMIWRDDVGWEVGGEFMFGSSCTPMVDSCQCMPKPIQYCKVKYSKNKNFKKSASYTRPLLRIICKDDFYLKQWYWSSLHLIVLLKKGVKLGIKLLSH